MNDHDYGAAFRHYLQVGRDGLTLTEQHVLTQQDRAADGENGEPTGKVQSDVQTHLDGFYHSSIGGYLIPDWALNGWHAPFTRRERVRNFLLRLLRRPVPERRWVPGLKERMRAQEVTG